MRQSIQLGRSSRVAVLVCSVVVALAVVPGAALATGIGDAGPADRGGLDATAASADTVVGPDETVTDDLTVTSGDVVVHGTVEGDVTALAGTVRVTGEVTGDVSATAGSVTVSGSVGDDISAGAGSVTLAEGADVAGDVSAGGGSVDVGTGATVGGDVGAGAGSAVVAEGATVDGSVSAGGGDARIHGTVEGDVSSGQRVVLGSTAVVEGDVTHRDGIERADGATVRGTVEHRADSEWSVGGPVGDVSPEFGPDRSFVPGFVPGQFTAVYWTVLALLIGGALLALFPAFSGEVVTRATTDPVRTSVAGFAALVGVPFVLLAFLISIIGIPVALAGGAAFVFAAWAGLVYGEYLLGSRLLAAADVDNRWAGLAVGVVGVETLSLLPLLGDLLKFVVLVVGFGALLLAAVDRWRDDDAGTEPARPPGDPSLSA